MHQKLNYLLVTLLSFTLWTSCSGCIGCTSVKDASAEERLEMAKSLELEGKICQAILQLDTVVMMHPPGVLYNEARENNDRLKKLTENTRKAWNALQEADIESAQNQSVSVGAGDYLAQLQQSAALVRETASRYGRIDLMNVDPELAKHIQNSVRIRQKHTSTLQSMVSGISEEYRNINDMYFNRQMPKREYQNSKYMIDLKYSVKMEPVVKEVQTEEAQLDEGDKLLQVYLQDKYCLALNDQ